MFQGLSTALTSLYANQQALDTTGNNIANVNTEGYSRQQIVTSPSGGSVVSSFWSTPPRVGTGVNVDDIKRIRDAFLDARSLQEHGSYGNALATKGTYDAVELIFEEPSDTGLQAQLSKFWNNWDDLASNPTDQAARTSVLEQAKTLVTGIQQAATNLDQLELESLSELKVNVSQINTWAQNIADLNTAIQSATNSGTTPNALLDKRDLLISKMSDLAGVSVKETQNGSVSVTIGGMAIVRDNTVRFLQVDESGAAPVLRWDADHDASTTTDGILATNPGGSLQGLMSSINTIIPQFKATLDGVATNLIATVNTQHAAGLDQSGNPGGVFFTGTDAATIDVDATLAGNPTLLAAAAAGSGAADGENARAMANLAMSGSGADIAYRSLINALGVASQSASNQASIQAQIVSSVDNSRDSISGVNLDEEMTNMIRYQKAYTASAKYLSVINDALDTLMGLVR